jgi:undecaprenyl-diphosphatase
MNIFQTVILGIVEGITEFLPVSSTFHLIFTSNLLHIMQSDFVKLFEVVIQGGAILSVLFLYLQELVKDKNLMIKVVAAFVPTAIVGFVLEKIIKSVFFESNVLMLTAFFLVGLIFIGLELFLKKNKVVLKKEMKDITVKEALIIGAVQSLAVVPGVSRAGSVIVGMIGLGYKRSDAAKFSFMLSIPTILAASALELFKMRDTLTAQSGNVVVLLVGCIVAFMTSYIVIKWFINYLKNHSLEVFGWYRIIMTVLILLAMYLHII